MYDLLLWMIGVHFIADFDMQSRFVAENKGKSWFIMMAHVICWTTMISLPLTIYGVWHWSVLFILIPIHWVSDWEKAEALRNPSNEPIHLLYLDQSIHMMQLVMAWAWCKGIAL